MAPDPMPPIRALLALALAGAARGGDAVSVQLVSIGPGGERANRDVTTVSTSGDGHFVAFTGGDFAANGLGIWYVRDTVAGTTEAHNQLAELALISDDGSVVAVDSAGPALTVFDRLSAQTVLSAPNEELRALSRNGRWVVGWFQDATSGVLIVHDLATGASRRLDLTHSGGSGTDAFNDIYRSDDAAVSDDGRWLAYQSTFFASDVGPAHTSDDGVYLYDLQSLTATRIQDHDIPVFSDSSTGGLFSRSISISADGGDVAYVALESAAVIRVYDRNAGFSYRISSAGDAAPNGDSRWPSLSADGRYVAFASAGSDLIDGDTNNHYDIFRYDRIAQVVMRVSVGPGGVQGDGDSLRPAIGADGSTIAFISGATTLVGGDVDGTTDAFLAVILDASVATPSPASEPMPPSSGGTPPFDNGAPGATTTSGTSVAVVAHCGVASGGALGLMLAAAVARRRRR
jgi:hypothetical protein